MKKALALVLAVVLAFGMAAVSFAADAAVDALSGAAVVDKDGNVSAVPEVVDPETPVYFFLLKDEAYVKVDDVSVKVDASSVKDIEGEFSLVDVKLQDGSTVSAVKFVCADPYLAKTVKATLNVVVTGKDTVVADTKVVNEGVKVTFSNPTVEAKNNLDVKNQVVTFTDEYSAEDVYTLWYGDIALKVKPNGQSNFYMEVNNDVDKDLVKADPDNNFLFVNVVGNPEFARDAVLAIPADEDLIVYSVSVKDDKKVYTKVDAKYVDGKYEITGKTFGSYVLATKEINAGSSNNNGNNTDNPNTGANDVVGVAAVFAVVSLAAAGAVAFKKASK